MIKKYGVGEVTGVEGDDMVIEEQEAQGLDLPEPTGDDEDDGSAAPR